jgi:hypothetical protein
MRAAGLQTEAWQNLAVVILSHHGKLHNFQRFEERLGCDEGEASDHMIRTPPPVTRSVSEVTVLPTFCNTATVLP